MTEEDRTITSCVIITAYKQPGFLTEAIASALSQTVRCGIVLVNDGCPDTQTDDICQLARTACPERMLYLKQLRQGPSGARNAGIELSRQAWPGLQSVFFLDGDNRLYPDALAQLARVMEETGVDWVFTDLQKFGIPGFYGLAGPYCLLEHMMGNFIDTGSLVSTRILDAGVRFDPKISVFEDWDFWLSAARKGFRPGYAAGVPLLYRARRESLLRSGSRLHPNGLQVQQKHADWIRPGTCARLEHALCPRFALIEDGCGKVSLFSDPAATPREMTLSGFADEYAAADEARTGGLLPVYWLAAAPGVVDALKTCRVFTALVWMLERAAASGATTPSYVRDAAGDLRLELDGRAPALLALSSPQLWLRANEKDAASAATGLDLQPIVSIPELPVADLTSIFRQMGDDIRDRSKSPSGHGFRRCNNTHRLRQSVARAVNLRFQLPAIYPVTAERAIGFAWPESQTDDEWKFAESVVADGIRLGFQAHVFTLSTQTLPSLRQIEARIDSKFRARWNKEARRERSDDLRAGLFAAFDIVVLLGDVETLGMAGTLRHFGGTVVWAASGTGPFRGSPARRRISQSLAFEYAIDAYLCESEAIRATYLAHGVPEAKLPSNLAQILRPHLK